jgi:hypothetical protein
MLVFPVVAYLAIDLVAGQGLGDAIMILHGTRLRRVLRSSSIFGVLFRAMHGLLLLGC